MLEPVVELLRASRRVSAVLPGRALRALGEHEGILRRVECRDAGGAREEMRVHLANTAEDIEAAIDEGVLDAGGLPEKEGV
jgi:DNA-binding GntR family transcriptional regulator